MLSKFFWGQKVEVEGDLWITKIAKSVYGTTVALNKLLLDSAIRAKAKLKVGTIDPKTNDWVWEVISPTEWKNSAVQFSKVFKRPDDPMIMYQRSVGKIKPEPIQGTLIDP